MSDDADFRTRNDISAGANTYRCTTVLQYWLADGRYFPTEVDLQYNSDDPFAVKCHFDAGTPAEVVWMFSRELLADGLFAPTGEGDVKVRPCPGDPLSVEIILWAPTGHTRYTADAADLTTFLFRTYEIVQPEDEVSYVDFDLELSRLEPR
ncbi:Streptomyces sporulation and cell division protein, SsgA [Amycolatopsis lurida]|uniref:Sporulation protein SsgA n=1 Tax=Amycolatopsis lurida NRRL 2430 TaxID=1460371 RepID=A0A2P2FGH7_AMYLU|nr:SsgA family sporulation/cell division regulator [Amycolatopsis lurida]KFU75814.1 hypothetical protein BB31_39660 [Amycolatopsis lurida NRRL 2430]SEE28557.1 Streptomyces sporulation and cell division protein, SsgA [Amycolatopsis lurida]